jgi:predicted enzyme related to lactoylglutathione lyase
MPPRFANGKINYVEIPAIDIQRSADFYAKVFDWRITRREDGSTAFEDTTGEVRGTWVVGRPASAEPGLLIFIVVENVPATIDKIVAEGGKVVPWIGENTPEIGRFHDPAGNVLGLFQDPSRADVE